MQPVAWPNDRGVILGLVLRGAPLDRSLVTAAAQELSEALFGTSFGKGSGPTASWSRLTDRPGRRHAEPLAWTRLSDRLPTDFRALSIEMPTVKLGRLGGPLSLALSDSSAALHFHGSDSWQITRVQGWVYESSLGTRTPAGVTAALKSAILHMAGALPLLTGYVAFDVVYRSELQGPYERAVGVNPFRTDWSRWIQGYYRGNFLSSGHVDALGGGTTLEDVDWLMTHHGPGWMWAEVRDPSPLCNQGRMRMLRDLLAPVLPSGRQTIEQYFSGKNAWGQDTTVQDFCL